MLKSRNECYVFELLISKPLLTVLPRLYSVPRLVHWLNASSILCLCDSLVLNEFGHNVKRWLHGEKENMHHKHKKFWVEIAKQFCLYPGSSCGHSYRMSVLKLITERRDGWKSGVVKSHKRSWKVRKSLQDEDDDETVTLEVLIRSHKKIRIEIY